MANTSAPLETRLHYWRRVLRPLLWWLLLVLILYGVRLHQRWMEQTRLAFAVTLGGQPLYSADATFDLKPLASGQKISLGSHIFRVTHPKGETFSTNLFIWYGRHDLGRIDLKRAMGTLNVSADPPADRLVIRGPEWSVILTNSFGLTNLVPTDDYDIEAAYPHWQKKYAGNVSADQTTFYTIAPHFGGLKLGCNQSDATFQLQTMDNKLVAEGILPASVSGLPAGKYQLIATHHGHQRTETVMVQADAVGNDQQDFQYGTVEFETSPSEVEVASDNHPNWGTTPLTLHEMLPGNWMFTLKHNGYQSVQVAVKVEADQTSHVSTNLMSETYFHAMTSARQFMAALDYERALQAANDALSAKLGDADAMTLQREAAGLATVQRAKKLGKQGEYMGGGKELKRSLEFLPDNDEAKQLIVDFKKHEPEQIERMRVERSALPKKTFDSFMASRREAILFETQELKTSKSAAETKSAIELQLKTVQPFFQILRSIMTGEIFQIEALQEFSGGERRCVIIGGQSKDDETQIFFKIVEFKKVSFFEQPLGALVGSDPPKYTMINPSQAQLSDKLKNQISEGVSNVTMVIQHAIEQ